MNVQPDISVKERIVSTALAIVEKHGVKALTQPRVAKAAGIRQSHLTYYFPKKSDLFIAVLEASHHRAAQKTKPAAKVDGFDEVAKAVRQLIFDPQRMRFFLSVVVEAAEAKRLAPLLAQHSRSMAESLAPHFGCDPDDPALVTMVDALRGLGLRMILEPDKRAIKQFDLEKFAHSFGLKKAR